MLLTRINKKSPMNIIIFSPQSNIHRTTQADIHSSVVYRLSKISDASSLTSLICRRRYGVKNRTKVQRIVDKLVNCENLNQLSSKKS